MTKKRINIILTPEQHETAKEQSRRLFGNVNLSQYIGVLIEREKEKRP